MHFFTWMEQFVHETKQSSEQIHRMLFWSKLFAFNASGFFGKEKNILRKENPVALKLLMAAFYYIITMLSHLFSDC